MSVIATRAPADSWALRPMTMTWKDGGAYALLGPSGCGKTTLLNIISGLIAPTRGKVLFDGRDVTALPPEARNIAQVFQFPVVYDTMTVFDNLAFPLRNRRWDRRGVRKRVARGRRDPRAAAPISRDARGHCRRTRSRRSRSGAAWCAGCRGGAVRRAADRDRSAREVAAAPQAQADSSAAQALAHLCHARSDRSADVRRSGRRHERRARSCRSARPSSCSKRRRIASSDISSARPA